MLNLPDPEKIISKISEINHIYPEEITLHRISKTPCSCLDPINKEPTNPNCPDCGGTGYIESDDPIIIPVSVSNNEQEVKYLPVGTYMEGEKIVTIDKKEVDQYNIDIKKIDYYTYNGEDYKMNDYQYGSLNGIIYEVRISISRKS